MTRASTSAEGAGQPAPAPRVAVWFALSAIASCLAFAAFTGHIWEDYFITFRASLNLATGHGLVFQPGEKVHTFTSPLGTLLPALFAIGGGENVAIRALWGLRIVSALAVGSAVWMAVRRFQHEGMAGIIVAGIGTALVVDPKIVDFSINGMETGFVVLFTVLTWHAFVTDARLWPCALACAGLQWTRPDGFVLFGAITVAWITFGRNPGISFRSRLGKVAQATMLGVVLYLPWLVFAWAYYGSPIPHTILAKSQARPLADVAQLFLNYPWRLLVGEANLHDIFKPAYFYMGGWPLSLEWISRILTTVAGVAWLWPRLAPAGRVASAAFFLGGFYVAYIPGFPWYYPGWQSLGWLTWAFVLHAVWNLSADRPAAATLPRSFARVASGMVIALQIILFACVAWQMRMQQSTIEDNHRREIGRWLASNAAPRDTVFAECLGYIGYYSKLKMLDYPGLAAPEVVAARKSGHDSFARVIDALQPTWLVLRPRDEPTVFNEVPALRAKYTLVRKFDAREKVDALRILPGRGYLNFDANFHVYRRQPVAGTQ